MIDAPNQWRLETPGHSGWERTARPNDPNKYFMASCDSHTNEPADLWRTRLEPKYRDRIPKSEIEDRKVGTVSVMPTGLDQQLSKQELADLVAFLKACR